MWGYFGALPVDDKRTTHETAFMGVAYLSPRKQTLLFTYAVEVYGDVDIEFESVNLEVNINGQRQVKPFEIALHRIAYEVTELYPNSKYSVQHIERNKWEITQLNRVFKHLFTGAPKIVVIPENKIEVIKNGKFHAPADKKFKKSMLINVVALWPADMPLKDTQIQVTIPGVTFHGRKQEARTP
jgi:hypothetical protein